jgi:hypothetical protein
MDRPVNGWVSKNLAYGRCARCGLPIVMSEAVVNAVDPSRIAGVLVCRRRSSLAWIVLLVLLAPTAWGQNWVRAETQLAAKILAVTGQGAITVEVSNRSSLGKPGLGPAGANEIRRGLATQLANLGARLVDSNAEQAVAAVRIALSENLQNYVWVAEIRLNSRPIPNQIPNQAAVEVPLPESPVVMVSFPRPEPQAIEPETAVAVLHKALLWSQRDAILDVAVIDGSPAHMLILDAGDVGFYRLQDGRWQAEQSWAITHSRPWPRDLRGRIELRRDHLFDVYLPGTVCRSTATSPSSMVCYEGDNAWPLGTSRASVDASFFSSRNYFTGAILPGVGKQTTTVPFYSAAALLRDPSPLWLFAAVDGHVHVLDGATDQIMEKTGWGSNIAAVRSGCGSGWQVLATEDREGSGDTVRAFEVAGREPTAASAALEIDGSVTALWTEPGETGAVAIAHNSETGRYDAFRLTLTCSR